MGGVGEWVRRVFGRSPRETRAAATEAELNDIERRVRVELDAGNTALAARDLRRAQRRFPSDPAVALLAGELLYDAGLAARAAAAFDTAARLDPGDAYAPAMQGAACLEAGHVARAGEALRLALRRDAESPEAHYWSAVLDDVTGEDRRALAGYRRAAALAPDDFFVPFRVTRKRFHLLAERAFRELERRYEGFTDSLRARNVELRIQDAPTPEQIEQDHIGPLWLGAFLGHTALEQSLEDPWSALPGYVTLFQRNLERECRDEAELYEQVRITLLHEIAHAHGREEDWMEERGLE